MKKVFILCALALLAFSCNTTSKIQSYVKNHCNEAHAYNPVTGLYQVMWTCDTLYKAPRLQAKCSTLNVCFDAAKGRFTGELVCDSLYPLKDIIPLVIPSFK